MFRNDIQNTLLFIPHYYDTAEPTDFQVSYLYKKCICRYLFTKMRNKHFISYFVINKTCKNNLFKVFK